METAGFALAAIDVDHRGAEAGRQVEAIDGAPLDVVGDNELKQGAPIRPTRDPAQLDWRAALGEVAAQRHLDVDKALFEIVERQAGEEMRRE
jgi:hypothetical protein